jgi:dolichol-phosphate mannosyltransferase
MSGFFVIKKKIFIENEKNLYLKGFKILFDVIYSTKKNLRIQDYKIKFISRKNNKSKMSLKILLHIILIIFQKKILKIF